MAGREEAVEPGRRAAGRAGAVYEAFHEQHGDAEEEQRERGAVDGRAGVSFEAEHDGDDAEQDGGEPRGADVGGDLGGPPDVGMGVGVGAEAVLELARYLRADEDRRAQRAGGRLVVGPLDAHVGHGLADRDHVRRARHGRPTDE